MSPAASPETDIYSAVFDKKEYIAEIQAAGGYPAYLEEIIQAFNDVSRDSVKEAKEAIQGISKILTNK